MPNKKHKNKTEWCHDDFSEVSAEIVPGCRGLIVAILLRLGHGAMLPRWD